MLFISDIAWTVLKIVCIGTNDLCTKTQKFTDTFTALEGKF